MFDACQDEEIRRWVPLPSPYTRESAEFFVRSYCPHGVASGQYWVWALRPAPEAPLLGVVEVRRDEAPGSASLGAWLAPGARGRGLMREGLAAVCANALTPAPVGLGYDCLCWGFLPGNERSSRLAEAVGFEFGSGEHRQIVFEGETRDLLVGTLRR